MPKLSAEWMKKRLKQQETLKSSGSCILERWCVFFPIGNIKSHVTHGFLITVALACKIYKGNSFRQHTHKRHLKQVKTIIIPMGKTDWLHQELSFWTLLTCWESDRILFCVGHSTDLIKVYTLAWEMFLFDLKLSILRSPVQTAACRVSACWLWSWRIQEGWCLLPDTSSEVC